MSDISRQLRARFRVAILAVACALFLSCVATGPGGKRSLILISESEEIGIGRQVAADVESRETIFPDSVWQAYLTEVGEKIAAVSDRPNLKFHFTVIESNQINAFAAPGGFLYFYTGILEMMDSEAELAAVMAHEISHVVGRHSIKTLQRAYGGIFGLQIALGDKSEGIAGQLAGTALSVALTGYGRGHELEADEFGVYYMEKAGYNPHAAVEMFTKLAELSGGGKRGFFENLTASHPDTKERITKIKEQIAEMPETVNDLPHFRDRYQLLKRRLPVTDES